MNDEDTRPFDQVAKLDLYEHPETGAELVAAYTEDGEEYVITNKKMVRKLIKYVEDDIDIQFHGTVSEDPYNHLQILNVEDYEPLQEFHELKPLENTDDHMLARENKHKTQRLDDEFEDEDLEHGYHQDLSFEDEDSEDVDEDLDKLLKDTEFEELDDAMFEEDMLEEDDLTDEDKQRLQAELDSVVNKQKH